MVLLKEEKEHADVVLVEECRNGDAAAFDEIVRRYKDRIYNVAYRLLGNHEDAQDIAQEVFVKAYKGIRGFRGTAKVYTWLYSIAGNLAKNRLRDGHRKGRDKGVSIESLAGGQDLHSAAVSPAQAASGNELNELLQRCIEELPEHYRVVFVLRTFENLSYDEIADVLGCPRGTVKSRLNQARSLLQVRLKALSAI